MVDLDSNPTKLIEVVAIGKQLLITRGALTTFSIANDVAKYFAIIPAMFMATYPALARFNIMGLHTPQSAVLAAVIFNALIIIALVPLALRGVKYRPLGAASLLRRNVLIYGVGGILVAISRHLDTRSALSLATPRLVPGKDKHMLEQLTQALRATLLLTLLTGLIYPAVVTGLCQLMFKNQANGSLVVQNGQVVGSTLLAQNFTRPEYFHPRPSAAGNDGYDPTASSGSNLGPTSQKLYDRVKASTDQFRKENPAYSGPIPADALTASGSGLDPDISVANANAQAPALQNHAAVVSQPSKASSPPPRRTAALASFGETRVNVLKLNLALDAQIPKALETTWDSTTLSLHLLADIGYFDG